jgi:recombination associated protein RdgC
MNEAGDGGKDDDGFDTNTAILTGELSQLIPDLLEALGGEMGAAVEAEKQVA